MKKFCVCYSYTVLTDAAVEAETEKEAIKKVLEILGEVQIGDVWEIN